MKPKPVKCYMDLVDFYHELGEASDGNRLFPSIKDLKTYYKCVDECGIVEVEVRLKRVVKKSNYKKSK